MDRRMKPLILLLLMALLCLTAEMNGLAQEAFQRSQKDKETQIIPPTATYLYVKEGFWGVRTGSGRVIMEPKWYLLRMMGEDTLIAKQSPRQGGKFGIVDYSGAVIVPFVYDEINYTGNDLWTATLTEKDHSVYHLYHGDGTLWSDTAWDGCASAGAILSLQSGTNTCFARLGDTSLSVCGWHSEHQVGLHTLTMDLDENQLARCPSPDVLLHLGDTAAKYLLYLFVTPQNTPDATLLNAADTSSLTVSYLYSGCFLNSASVSRVKIIEGTEFPTYLLQMQVSYRRMDGSRITDRVTTSMQLTVTANANGTYGYTAFFDPQSAFVSPAEHPTAAVSQ